MIGTHGRDRPVLADDGGVVVRAHQPLRLEHHDLEIRSVTLESRRPCLGRGRGARGAPYRLILETRFQEHRPTRSSREVRKYRPGRCS